MSGRLPALKPKDVLRVLTRAGFYLHHATGSHYFLKHPEKTRHAGYFAVAQQRSQAWHTRINH